MAMFQSIALFVLILVSGMILWEAGAIAFAHS